MKPTMHKVFVGYGYGNSKLYFKIFISTWGMGNNLELTHPWVFTLVGYHVNYVCY